MRKLKWCTLRKHTPGDFVKKVKQINSQSDSILMSSFAYLTIRSSVCVSLIRDPCIFNLYDVYWTWSCCVLEKLHQCALHFNDEITRTNFLQLQPSIRPVPAQVTSILLLIGPPKLCIKCYLAPLWAFPPKSPGCFVLRFYLTPHEKPWCWFFVWCNVNKKNYFSLLSLYACHFWSVCKLKLRTIASWTYNVMTKCGPTLNTAV